MTTFKLSGMPLLGLFLAATLAIAGCWGSKFTLIPPGQAKVDLAYVGNWDAIAQDGKDHVAMFIGNIDGKLYYVDVRDSKNSVDRYVGFIANVNGSTFAHVREMKDNGEIENGWMLVRISLADDKLTIEQLSEDFMKTKTIESPEQLRQVLEQNLNNPDMYAAKETITATRVKEKK